MPEYYRVLREELKKRGINTAKDLADIIGRSHTYVNMRLCGMYPWALDEVYHIMDDVLHVDASKIPVIFPRGGMYAGELEDKGQTKAERLLEAIRAALADE